MSGAKATARYEAVDWAIRAQDAAFDDWEALADWLAADPHHAVLYDQATIGADDAARAMRQEVTSTVLPPVVTAFPAAARLPRRWLPLALAASVVAAIGGSLLYRSESAQALYTVSTEPGGRHSIVLAGAVRVDLNGDTSVTLDRKNPRFARIDRGEAMFTVEHDPHRPFELHAGNALVEDIGTRFDIERDGEVMHLGVAQGAVRVTTVAGSVTVTAGQTVTVGENGGTIGRAEQDIRNIGGWRNGQIDFVDLPLAQLASRLHRASGAHIVVTQDVAGRRVSGSIVLGADKDGALEGLGPLLGISVDRRADGWIWSGRVRAKPD
ncbi:hypothetical protein GCM10009087_00920 [Sphingomonas oligophenolica]|uniref:FecR domain-containing protein n=1 Tax=Sphingomonas oligophenolica TaxID=301154 RepID=A0ABU9Y1B3_9SPHN